MRDFEGRKKRKKTWIILGLCICILLILTAAAYIFTFHINHFRVDLSVLGEQEIVLEYGESFEDPGAQARFLGSCLLKEGREVPVSIEGVVDSTKVGTYTLQYTASFEKWSAAATRTVRVVDTVPPVIELSGSLTAYVAFGQEYQEEGFRASDNYNGDISDVVFRTVEEGKIIYTVKDSSGNAAQASRELIYYDPSVPFLTLAGGENITIAAGTAFAEPGYRAMDSTDGDLTGLVAVSGAVDIYHVGTYVLTYEVTNSLGNTATAARTVNVAPAQQPETVTPEGKVIYLTFDDGPGPYTRQLLDILKKYDVKATFFVINSKYIDLIQDIAAEGHAIGIHSVCHDYQTIYAGEEAFVADLFGMQAVIEEKTGIRTTLMRFPGGSSNTVSRRYDEGIMTRLTRMVTDMGFQYFDWNVDSDDAGRTRDTEDVFQNVIEGVQKHDVSIVLQHDIKEYSVAAVEKIIVWGLENGYSFLPLDCTSPALHHDINN